MITKENFYLSPIINLSLIDYLVFYLKFVFFIIASSVLIFLSIIFSKLIPLFGKWLPVLFHKMLLWLLSVEVEIVGEIDQAKKSNLFDQIIVY